MPPGSLQIPMTMKNETRILLTRDRVQIDLANACLQRLADAITSLANSCGVTHTQELAVCIQEPIAYALAMEGERLMNSMAGLKIPKYAIEKIAELEPEKRAEIEAAADAHRIALVVFGQPAFDGWLYRPDSIAFANGKATVTQETKDRITERYSLYAETADEIKTLRLLQAALIPLREIYAIHKVCPTKMLKFDFDGTVEIRPQAVKWMTNV